MNTSTLKQALIREGYCVVKNCLDAPLISDLREWSATALSGIGQDHRKNNLSQGSLINLSDHPEFAAVIGCDALRTLFSDLAFPNPIFSSGYIISKPPKGPPLFWHQDWWGWDDPLSYTDNIAQVFVMIYLTKTTKNNGCLRVIPGSHRTKHPLHTADAAHGETLSKVTNPDHPLYQSLGDEVDVPVNPGDLVIGDARLLHGAHANQSAEERTLLTLWFHPDYQTLPAGMRARIMEIFYRRGVDTDPSAANAQTLEDWPEEQLKNIQALLPHLDEDVRPHAWNREPDPDKLVG